MDPPPAYSNSKTSTSFQDVPLHSGPTLPVYTIRTTSSRTSTPTVPSNIYRSTSITTRTSTTSTRSQKWVWCFKTSATSIMLLFFAAFIVILIILLFRYAFK